jgi:hypothetical protein
MVSPRTVSRDGTSHGIVLTEIQNSVTSVAIKPYATTGITITAPHGNEPHMNATIWPCYERAGNHVAQKAYRVGTEWIVASIFAGQDEIVAGQSVSRYRAKTQISG